MDDVTRINRGPHRTPRPGDHEPLPGSFEQLPANLRTKILLGGAAAILVVGGLVGAVLAFGDHQSKPTSNSPAPAESDYQSQDNQPLNGS